MNFKIIKIGAHCLGALVGSSLSPTWVLMEKALRGYFDMNAVLNNPYLAVEQYIHFQQMVLQQPQEVFLHLFPSLILITVFGILFVAGCSHVFGWMASNFAQRSGLISSAS